VYDDVNGRTEVWLATHAHTREGTRRQTQTRVIHTMHASATRSDTCGADLDDARTHGGGNEEWHAGEARQRKDE
jgi:hypothetical protein